MNKICNLPPKQLGVLFKSIKEDGASLCEDCIPNDTLYAMKEKTGDNFWNMFDTGKCDNCDRTNDIFYTPLWNFFSSFFTTEPNIINNWCQNYPRLKVDILRELQN